MFKVHKSVLKMHSAVFKDMFVYVPSHGAHGDDYEVDVNGTPILCLYDSVEEVEGLIGALYTPG